MTAAFEPIHMSGIMPFTEIMRISLLGNHERMSAQRAYEIGMVSEVAPAGELMDARRRGPPRRSRRNRRSRSRERCGRSGRARELGGRQALNLGYAYVAMGTNPDSIAEGQKTFESGKRIDWRLR